MGCERTPEGTGASARVEGRQRAPRREGAVGGGADGGDIGREPLQQQGRSQDQRQQDGAELHGEPAQLIARCSASRADLEMARDGGGPGGREPPVLMGVEVLRDAAARRRGVGGVQVRLEPGGPQTLPRPTGELRDRVRAASQLRRQARGVSPSTSVSHRIRCHASGSFSKAVLTSCRSKSSSTPSGAVNRSGTTRLEVLDGVLVAATGPVDGLVAHHAHEIGRESAARPAAAQDRLEDLQERLLRDVVGIVGAAEAPRQAQRLVAMTAVQHRIGAGVPGTRGGQQLVLRERLEGTDVAAGAAPSWSFSLRRGRPVAPVTRRRGPSPRTTGDGPSMSSLCSMSPPRDVDRARHEPRLVRGRG